jgi:heat shock protein HslJ
MANACGSGTKAGVSTPSSTATSLEGTNWVLARSTALGVSLGGVIVSAELQGGTVTGTSGCNRYHAPYTLAGSKLTIGPIATTQMACGPAQTAVERAYLERLAKVAGFDVSGATLTLTETSGQRLLEFTASVGPKLLEGNWTVTGYYAVTAVKSVVGGVDITATFTPAAVNGSTGCNSYQGPYEASGAAINIGPVASTLKACPTPDLADQEQHYLSALQLAATFKVTGPRLELLRADGGTAVILERA